MKLTQSQKIKNKLHRKEMAELRRRKEAMFPKCIELQYFPECENVIKTKIKEDCIKCPYFDKVVYMKEIKKEIESSKKQFTKEEYENHLKEVLDEESFNEWKESQTKEVKKVKEEIKTIKKKEGIANEIRILAKEGERDINVIYNKIKNKFNDRDEKYLKMRIETSLKYFKKRGEI